MGNPTGMDARQWKQVGSGRGFFAALDQSGGSTPKALAEYGVPQEAYSGDEEMFDQVHAMRTRVFTAPAFTDERVLAAILFEDTMRRQVEGRDTGDYLWSVKGVVPILKIDKGLADEADGVQLMKPIPGLDDTLAAARAKGMFGTKMRSVVKHADDAGIAAIADQQFELGRRILDAGLVPILEPEVDIHSPTKAEADALLRAALLARLEDLPGDVQVMLKLSLPDADDFYRPLIDHPRVLRVVALSGGYSRDEACQRLARQPDLIASFSRALLEGLHADQDDAEFDRVLAASIAEIYAASTT
ncbi:fructose bisphosphate aldolase [Pseudonocardia sp. CA-107938]|uniref:fructose bisphosphate aldolase n=1 Tax=Pseudonocardia sp. CA-107938 TaxID=3240021 RepID=UPI003D8F1CFC